MACSKIFSGDLPELTYEIIKYFKDDFSTLHSCILVNRLWCRLAIPLLWENPFSIPTGNYNFIEIYLYNLNGDLKTKLNEYKINDDLSSTNTLFNYPSFIKYLNTWRIITSIEKWSEDIVRTLKPEYRYSLGDLGMVSNFRRLIQMSLFKIFIENEVNLHTLDVEVFTFFNYNSYYDDIIELFLQNPNFIHNVKNLKLYIGGSSGFTYHNDNDEYTLINNRILQMINLHQNLKKVLLSYNNFPLYQPLLLSKDYNCSNTLNTIIFYRVNFKGINYLNKIFEQLNVLESVHIVYCSSLDASLIQQIINLTKPFKLKSLFISGRSHVDESLLLLLQKSGHYLENFGCGYGIGYGLSLKQLLESIIKYCKNIKLFDSCKFENQIVHLVFNLIENIKQNLNYLSINVFNDIQISNNNIECSSILLQSLGQALPSKLEYLNLSLHIKTSDFEIFLENSHNTFIKKLLINNIEGQDILPYVKEYIMKKKRVKYLAIMDSVESTLVNGNYSSKELHSSKDEVKEFRLYDIKVQTYYSLLINMYGFIKECD
ncbi:hypothetical protein RclHR1_14770003 [Rhizophagus clarus]|uniref:F-box domain-containing protein n=1 Tax=Rhizophagus clarus TaxID=94130 RepID=A0A2Z6QQW8_9GLOM|nr:hypothetical protein RclHR1_14770003 [Rhizophagus clarus]GES72794.1 hypothetical protein GLOIN_2v1871140 [Rhizophagus clarus]